MRKLKSSKMSEKIFWFSISLMISEAVLGSAWSWNGNGGSWFNVEDHPKLNKTVPYCYHFTWMGGKFNKWTFKNIRNKTCSQYFKDRKTLCINPMVATYKGGKPDIGYILREHAEEATCGLSQEHVCVKYTVYYNGIISYETRYCSTVNIEMEGPMQNGCIEEKRGSQVIEVCACKSQPGADGICNSASYISHTKPFFSTLLIYLFYLYFMKI